jgi:hypothetical protein
VLSDKYDVENDPNYSEELVHWMQQQVEQEIKVIESKGAKAIPIPVKNCGILHEKEHLIVNRVEVNTGFNFDKVQRLMLTDPIPCPVRTGYWYVSVLLFTDKPVPLILPYTYEKNKHNKLAEWVFINNNMARSRHAVNFAD